MKIRCKNCYHVLKENEEYCTFCGEHSVEMQKAMQTGDFGPDNSKKLKQGLLIYFICGFIISGGLQIVFALLQAKEISKYTDAYCGVNSLFYSSIFTAIFMFVYSLKDLREKKQKDTLKNIIWLLVGILLSVGLILLSQFVSFVNVLPKYITNYFDSGYVFFDIDKECIFKVVVSFLLIGLSLEVIVRKRLIDYFDETLLGEFSILLFTSLITTFLEIAWIMSLDVIIPIFLMNVLLTKIYMSTNGHVLTNIIIRIIFVILTIIILI